MMFRDVVAAYLTLIFALTALPITLVHAADVVIFSTVAAKSALEELAPAFERESKHKLIMRFATAAEMKAEIEKGVPCDVAILTAAAIDDLVKQGRLNGATRVNVARSGVGIAVKQEVSARSVATADDLKQLLLSAKSIAYSATGATGPIMKQAFERLGITEAMTPKTIVVTATTTPEAIASGKAEVGFSQISEILDTPGVRLVSALPADVQIYSLFAAAAATGAKDPAAAQYVLQALTTPAAKAVLKAKGLDPN
jgi:molybdate transport system substrate-binding protein